MTAPFDFFAYKKGVLSAGRLAIPEIVKKTGTPVYVYSADAFLAPLRALQRGLGSVPHLICFAVKSNSNVGVLKLISKAGGGMDLVSGGELFRAGLAKVPGERIVFSGVGKTPAEMEQALKYDGGKGIYSFNVESIAELESLSRVARKLGKQAPVALRFNPDVNPKTHPYISTGLKKNKFGMPRSEVVQVARELKRYPGIRIRGISIHIGSQLTSLSPMKDAFARLRELCDELNDVLPAPLEFVDLGGGVGITYRDEKPPRLDDYCKLILRYFGPSAKLAHPLKIVIEPGRTLSGNSGVLVTEVLYRKERGKKDFLILDAAMNDLIRPSLYGSYHGIAPIDEKKSRGRKKPTDVVGPVCESGDCFASDRAVPVALGQGDLVALLSAGAYGFTMSSNYNSRPRPAEVLVRNGKFEIIRERESYRDLVRGERY